MTPQDWLTLQDLGTQGGLILAVTVIVQFIKGDLDRIRKVPTRYAVLLISWGLLLARSAVAGELTGGTLLLDFVNGFFVALAAMGTYQVAKSGFNGRPPGP